MNLQNLPQLSPSSLDLDELLGRCLGRLDLVEKVLGRFQDALDQELEQLEAALQTADYAEITRIAHRIKGTSATVSAHRLQYCAAQLETYAAQKQRHDIEDSVATIKQECVRFSYQLPFTP